MAEAHSAVAFSFAITHEGVHFNYDTEVLNIIYHSGIRSWRRKFLQLFNHFRCGIFPASLGGMALTVGTYNALYLSRELFGYGIDPSFGIIEMLKKNIHLEEPVKGIVCCTISGLGFWFCIFIFMKYSLKGLFLYQGWMYEERGRGRTVSWGSRAWIQAIKILTILKQPMLYSYQAHLPQLPVPALKDTMDRYLCSVRPLLDDENYSRMEGLAREFQGGIGRKLQRYVVLKSWWAPNYVSDWWEEFVYLRGRSPIMVNSNFYGTDSILVHPTSVQAARAANVVHTAFLFRRLIDRQQLQPIMVQNTVPLCSWQYERTFNTTRIPGIQTDRLVHFDDSTHIAVYHAGRYFRVPCYYKAQLLEPKELQLQFERILADESVPCKGEEKVGALTAGHRTHWAQTREKFFSAGTNKVALDIIERAAFVLVLENDEYDYDQNDPTQLDRYGRAMLHGNGCDRWYDKSFNVIVMRNGRIGFNAEHGWADAAIIAHLWEYVLSEDLIEIGYEADGNCKGEVKCDPPHPTRLKWDLNHDGLQAIDVSVKVAEALLNDVDLKLHMHAAYGKGFMKNCRVSPDAYIQMALQLAYYRDAGRFNLTYEASMTRLFREGRTETVRPCTIESAAWVKAFEGKTVSKEECATLLRKACARHQRGYQDAMCGKGIDRHLFCLYVISKYLEVNSPFLSEVLSEPWRLSTSQTPHGQTNKLDLSKHPECISAGGGFGPVADDGYGVSYIIAGEDTLFFHVSSKKSSPVTSSTRFAQEIDKALTDIRNLMESVSKK